MIHCIVEVIFAPYNFVIQQAADPVLLHLHYLSAFCRNHEVDSQLPYWCRILVHSGIYDALWTVVKTYNGKVYIIVQPDSSRRQLQAGVDTCSLQQ